MRCFEPIDGGLAGSVTRITSRTKSMAVVVITHVWCRNANGLGAFQNRIGSAREFDVCIIVVGLQRSPLMLRDVHSSIG
jgi:hypothetical protein